MWFGSQFNPQIGYVTTAGLVQMIGVSNLPAGLAADASGNVWFTQFGANIGFVNVDGTAPTEFATQGATPYPPIFSPAGDGIWFPDGGALLKPALVGVATPAGISEWSVRGLANGFVLDPNGTAVYFTTGPSHVTASGYGGDFGRISV